LVSSEAVETLVGEGANASAEAPGGEVTSGFEGHGNCASGDSIVHLKVGVARFTRHPHWTEVGCPERLLIGFAGSVISHLPWDRFPIALPPVIINRHPLGDCDLQPSIHTLVPNTRQGSTT